MIYCTLIDDTLAVGHPLAGMLGRTASFTLSATLATAQAWFVVQEPESDIIHTPVFYVATPNPAVDLATLAGQGNSPIVVLSANPAHAAIAYDYSAVDFLLLPLDEKRLHGCLAKLTRFIQQANNSYADSFHRLGTLTKTQRVVLRKIGELKTTVEIAEELFLSIRTVDTHRSNIREVLGFLGRRPLTPFALLAVEKRLI